MPCLRRPPKIHPTLSVMPAESLRKARVLVVDDHPDAVDVIRQILMVAGCREVVGLSKAAQAVEEFRRFLPDLVILDLIMPEKSGFEIMRELRESTSEHSPVPILIVTADPTLEARRQALEYGATDFLAKPFDAMEITLRAENLLKTLFLHRQLRSRLEQETAALAEAEADYRSIFENMPVGVCQTTPQGRFVTANAALSRILGDASPESLMERLDGKLGDLYVDPHRRDEFIHRMMEHGLVEGFESQVRRRDGSLIWIRENARVIRHEDGSVRRFEGTTEDVTRQRETEEDLRSSREKLKGRVKARSGALAEANRSLSDAMRHSHRLAEAIHNSPMAVVISDPNLPENPLIFVNPAFTRITGYRADEVIGLNCRFLRGKDTDRALVAKLRAAIANRETFQEIILNYRKDGTPFWNELTVSPVLDGEGKLINFVGMQLDVTDRQRALEAERQTQQQLQALVGSIDEIVFEIDPEGRYANVWTRDESLLSAPREELIGRTMAEVLGEKVAAPFLESLHRVIERGVAESLTYAMEVRAGKRWFLARLNPILAEDGRCRGICLLSRDITDRHQIEVDLRQARDEAERANEAKSDFLSRMSHELRTPLNAILGFGQLLEMQQLHEAAGSNLDQIMKAGRHLLELINEVLQISGIEAGRMEISLEPVHVGAVLREVCAIIHPTAQAREIQLVVAESEFDWYVQADRQRLMQVLLNFIANAVKYNRVGGRVVLSGEVLADDVRRISVADTGPGIAIEEQDKLFTPFERLAAHRTSGIEGTGLGLALSKKLVEHMDGTVGVESEEGRGSRFWFTLPGGEAPEKALLHSLDSSPHDFFASRESRLRILYIEDNLSNLRLIEKIFSEYPRIELLSSMQGRMGLELALRHQPDLILLDVHLPDLSGEEVLRQLRQTPLTKAIPVVMLSADATPRQVERFMGAGASAYLTKPIDVRKLLQAVEDQLNLKGTTL